MLASARAEAGTGSRKLVAADFFGAARNGQLSLQFEHGLRQSDGVYRQRESEARRGRRQHLNIHLGRAKVGRFSDGEVMVEMLENVRGKDVFVLQSICTPTNDNLMELLVMVGCAEARLGRRASPRRFRTWATRARTGGRARRACAITRESRGEHDGGGRRGPRADDGSALGADPGFFRHSGGQHLLGADPAGRRVEARLPESGGGVAGRRRRGAGAGAGEAAGSRSRDHRQAAAAAERGHGDEHHRRSRRAAPA